MTPSSLRPLANAVALIDEERCIGCTLCIQACPVDAIVGAAKLMHTVLTASCTGCELCVPPCPVDCIALRPIAERTPQQYAEATLAAERRHLGRNARVARLAEERASKTVKERADQAERRKRATVSRAIERARERLQARKAPGAA